MASNLLLKLINKAISVENLELWLNDVYSLPENTCFTDSVLSRAEFAVYFLNFLRDETARFPLTQKNNLNSGQNNNRSSFVGSNSAKKSNVTPKKQDTSVYRRIGVQPNSSNLIISHNRYSPGQGRNVKLNENRKLPQNQEALSPESAEYDNNFPKLNSQHVKRRTRKDFPSIEKTSDLGSPDEILELKGPSSINSMLTNDSERYVRKLSFSNETSIGDLPVDRKNSSSSLPDGGPSLSLVVYKEELSILAHVYSVLLDINLVPNITMELKFVLNLLLLNKNVSRLEGLDEENSNKEKKLLEKPKEENDIFINISSCVYFAIQTLTKQMSLFGCLDTFSIKLLSENDRILLFSPSLSEKFSELYLQRVKSNKMKVQIENNSMQTVTFQCDKDQRSAFNSEKSFRIFRKQRDSFYNLLQDWSDDNNSIHWDIEQLSKKVNFLLDLSSDPINMSHLVKLLIEQLINSILQQDVQHEKNDLFIRGHENKWLQLHKRLVQPLYMVDANEGPTFLGEECFFKEFICAASNNLSFVTTFQQVVLLKISELTKQSILLNDKDEGFSEDDKSDFLSRYRTLILLGKFLGLITFQNFKDIRNPSPTVSEELIHIRQKAQPFNLSEWLERSIEDRTLVLTVPWIVECIFAVDHIGLNIAHIKSIIESLVSLYLSLKCNRIEQPIKAIPTTESSNLSHLIKAEMVLTKVSSTGYGDFSYSRHRYSNICMKESVAILLRFYISKIFNNSVVTEEIFYNSISPKELKVEGITLEGKQGTCLDMSNLVSQAVVHKYCPHITQLKFILALMATQSKVGVRHITPIKISTYSSECSSSMMIQMKLEDSFFNRYKGLRSTIDFIIDRLVSICKNYITTKIFETENDKIIARLKDLNIDKEKFQEVLSETISKSITEMEQVINVSIAEHFNSRISSGLAALLSSDCDKRFLSTCEKIARRKFKEHIKSWLGINFPSHEKITEKIMVEYEKKCHQMDLTFANDLQKSERPSLSESLTCLQNLMTHIAFKKDPKPEYIKIVETLHTVCDNVKLENQSVKVLQEVYVMTWDLTILIATYIPEQIDDKLLEYLSKFWLKYHHGDNEKRILSVRNVVMAAGTGRKESSLQLANLIAFIVKKELLSVSDLENQALSLLRHSWQKEELQFINDAIKHTLYCLKDSPYYDDKKFGLWIEFIKETIGDIADL